MTARKNEKPKPDCSLCQGRGWFYAGHDKSVWPSFCHRCYSPQFIAKMRAPSNNRSATTKVRA